MFSDAQQIGVGLSEAIAIGDWRMLFVERDRIRAVTLADVQRVGQEYLTQSNRTEGQYIPTEKPVRAPLPASPDLQKDLTGYAGDANIKQAQAFDSSPANIDARTQRKDVKLANGSLKLALLPKESRGDRVRATMDIQNGSVDSLKGQRVNTIATADLLLKGTSRLTRQQISDRIDALNAEVSVTGSGTDLTISMSTTRANIDALISLMLEVVRDANFPQDQVDEYTSKLVTSIKSSMTEPTAIASRMLARHDSPWAKDDIRYMPTFDESFLPSVRSAEARRA